MKDRIRIVIADDHTIFREGLRRLLLDQPEFVVIGEAASGAEAIRVVGELRPDVLLLDLQLQDMTGIDVLRRLGVGLMFQTIILAADIRRADVIGALLLGAAGAVPKDSVSETLFKSIRAVASGQLWVGREVMASLVEMVRSPNVVSANSLISFGITQRELEVVKAVVKGLGNKEIAESLGISQCTVKHCLTRIFDKVGVSNRVELTMLAARQLHESQSVSAELELQKFGD